MLAFIRFRAGWRLEGHELEVSRTLSQVWEPTCISIFSDSLEPSAPGSGFWVLRVWGLVYVDFSV